MRLPNGRTPPFREIPDRYQAFDFDRYLVHGPALTPPPFVTSAPMRPIHVIGGGLAGSEATWQAAEAGIPVVLHEMRPVRGTPAHRTGRLAELVCSNSFRSDDSSTNAVGVLHREMRAMGSFVMLDADAHQAPASRSEFRCIKTKRKNSPNAGGRRE